MIGQLKTDLILKEERVLSLFPLFIIIHLDAYIDK